MHLFRLVTRTMAPVLLALSMSGCATDSTAPSRANATPARAFGLWNPGTSETCTKEQHDAYSTVGPDGKLYPTWHPPVDPASGCRFGHEHGRDPRGSRLSGLVGDIPFGYANEQLDITDPANPRHEDHVGHKVEWENDIPMRVNSDVASPLFDVRCDVLVKLHQGTHSKDAFTNNVHELVYHIACNDGVAMHVTMLTAIGTPGEFVRSCDGTTVKVGPPTPLNSPKGGGQRKIPDKECVLEHMLVGATRNSNISAALHESWETHNVLRREDGSTIASFDPYFQVPMPSRFYDPAAGPTLVGRPIDMCYATETNGDQARGSACAEPTGSGAISIPWDDPRSPWNGVQR